MKTITLYHPHTHAGIAYDPPPEGVELTVNDADAAVLDAWGLTTPPVRIEDAPVTTDVALAPRHDRRVRVAMPAANDAHVASVIDNATRTE